MIGPKDSNNDICVYMSARELSKNEIRSINGAIMKIVFTIKFRLISNNSKYINSDRGNNIERKGKIARENAGESQRRE